MIDELTELSENESSKYIFHMREYFQERLDIEKQRVERYHGKISIVFIKLKEFKNELRLTFYQPEVSNFIREVAEYIFSLTRVTDIAAWYDYDTIAFLLCETTNSGAQNFTKRLNEQLSLFLEKKFADNSSLINKIVIDTTTYPDDFIDNRNQSSYFNLPDNLYISLIGKHLRKTFLNELPQLISILMSDMNLVKSHSHLLTKF